MIRASSRSAVSHLHVVASQPATMPDDAPLIERAVELGVLAGAVRRLADGEGGVVVLDAPAGLGKTALLERAALFAADSGCLVRRAAPGPLERHFPFGVVRALLEAPLREASGEERAQLLDGAAAAAGTLLLEGTVPGGDSTMLLAHSVLWLCAAIADRRPLALVVDDAQWADRSSLEVLAYLARRIDDLPLLIAVGARADDPRAASDLLSLLGGVRSATVLHPQRLTRPRRGAADPPAGAGRVGGRCAATAIAPSAATRGCWASSGARSPRTGRNRSPRPATTAPPVSRHRPQRHSLAPGHAERRATARSPRRWRSSATARQPHVVAAVAGVPPAALGPARDALLAAGLLDAEGERLAHGLVAAAIGEDLTRTECERLHREAARALMAGHAEADVVASHLLQCPPQADPDVSELLRVRRVDGGAARRAAHRRGLPRARARGARAGRRPRSDARPAGDARLRRRPARFAAAPARCAARGARSREPHRRPHAPGRAQRPRQRRRRSCASCSSRSWRARAIPARASRSRPRRSTR